MKLRKAAFVIGVATLLLGCGGSDAGSGRAPIETNGGTNAGGSAAGGGAGGVSGSPSPACRRPAEMPAVTLTYDDSLPTQLSVAAPLLEQYGL